MLNSKDPNTILTCPYNPSHRILRFRMARHLVKCRRQVLEDDLKYEICIYNTTHSVPEQELKYHLEVCPDRFNLDKHVVISESVDRERFPVPKLEIESEECWDDVHVPSYNPQTYCENNPVLRQKNVASATTRKDFRMEERARIQNLYNMGPINTDQPPNELRNKNRNVTQSSAVTAGRSNVVSEDDPYSLENIQQIIRSGAQLGLIVDPSYSHVNRLATRMDSLTMGPTPGSSDGADKEGDRKRIGSEENGERSTNIIQQNRVSENKIGKGRGRRNV